MMMSTTGEKYLSLNGTLFRQYTSEELGTDHECNIVNVKENGENAKLGRETMKITLRVEESEEYN